MIENLKKTLDKGVEYAFMTTEKIVKAAKELAQENNLTKEEAKKLLDYLQKKSEETRRNMGKTMQDFLKASLRKMDIPTREEVKKLDDRIRKLEGTKKKPAAARKKATPKAKKSTVKAKQ
ncbi:MAG: phasin family protein [Bacteroidales bacterium]|nr:phasin family protein [Deltaproteobacteria bacterium]MBL7138509.1 phasin family protein [Bacteroidales bacterium]